MHAKRLLLIAAALVALCLPGHQATAQRPIVTLNRTNVLQAEASIRIQGSTLRQELARLSWWHVQCHGRPIVYTEGTPSFWIQPRPDGETFTQGRYFDGYRVRGVASSFTWDRHFFCQVWLHEDWHFFAAPGNARPRLAGPHAGPAVDPRVQPDRPGHLQAVSARRPRRPALVRGLTC